MAKDFWSEVYGNKSKRQPVASSQKKIVFDKQNGKCWRCKKRLMLSHTHYHHLKAVHKGGKSTTDNLVAVCSNCHNEIHMEEKSLTSDKKKKKTKSIYGNKWGRKTVITSRLKKDIQELLKQGLTLRQIQKQVFYYDKNNNKKTPSLALVHKLSKD